MITLGDKIRGLRGQETFARFAQRTGVSTRALHDIEHNKPVRLGTLKQVARGCRTSQKEWSVILILWFRNEIGDEEFFKLDIAPRPKLKHPGAHVARVDPGELVLSLFFRLDNVEQAAVLKAMARPGVCACLPAINRAYEEAQRGLPSFKEPEIVENVARGLQKGDILFSRTNAPAGKILTVRQSKPKRSGLQ